MSHDVCRCCGVFQSPEELNTHYRPLITFDLALLRDVVRPRTFFDRSCEVGLHLFASRFAGHPAGGTCVGAVGAADGSLRAFGAGAARAFCSSNPLGSSRARDAGYRGLAKIGRCGLKVAETLGNAINIAALPMPCFSCLSG